MWRIPHMNVQACWCLVWLFGFKFQATDFFLLFFKYIFAYFISQVSRNNIILWSGFPTTSGQIPLISDYSYW